MAARWRITNNVPRDDLGGDGRFTPSREITFEVLDNGHTGTIMVPLRNLTPEFVAAEVQKYADTLLDISNLSS